MCVRVRVVCVCACVCVCVSVSFIQRGGAAMLRTCIMSRKRCDCRGLCFAASRYSCFTPGHDWRHKTAANVRRAKRMLVWTISSPQAAAGNRTDAGTQTDTDRHRQTDRQTHLEAAVEDLFAEAQALEARLGTREFHVHSPNECTPLRLEDAGKGVSE